MARVVRVRYENGVLKPLEKLDLSEGEEVEVVIRRRHDHAFGALLRRRPDLKPEDVNKVIEEIESEGIL
ncbi:MAG: antitoxin family protein [Ignisphaera sp.]